MQKQTGWQTSEHDTPRSEGLCREVREKQEEETGKNWKQENSHIRFKVCICELLSADTVLFSLTKSLTNLRLKQKDTLSRNMHKKCQSRADHQEVELKSFAL